MKWWIAGLSALLVLPFLGFAGFAIVAIATAHGSVSRITAGCLFAAGATACAVIVVLGRRAVRNRLADEAIERRARWDGQADASAYEQSADNHPDQGLPSPRR
jgi:hypothetical protein